MAQPRQGRKRVNDLRETRPVVEEPAHRHGKSRAMRSRRLDERVVVAGAPKTRGHLGYQRVAERTFQLVSQPAEAEGSGHVDRLIQWRSNVLPASFAVAAVEDPVVQVILE